MENFKPSGALDSYWGLIEEGVSLEELQQIISKKAIIEDNLDDIEVAIVAAQEYYENWHSKIIVKSIWVDKGIFKNVNLFNHNIKACGVLVTELSTYLFFVKNDNEEEHTQEDFFEDLADTNGDIYYGVATEEELDKINKLFGITLRGDDLNQQDLVIIHSCDRYKICLTKDKKLILLWSDIDVAEITEEEVTLDRIGSLVKEAIDTLK